MLQRENCKIILLHDVLGDSEDILIHFLSGDCWWKKWRHSLCLLTYNIWQWMVFNTTWDWHIFLSHYDCSKVSLAYFLHLLGWSMCLSLVQVSQVSLVQSLREFRDEGKQKFEWNIAILSCANCCLIQPPADLDWWRMKRGLWNSWNH